MEAVSTKTETTSDFQRDWIECQKNLKNPKELATGNYANYASLEQILKECTPVLNQYNFTIRHAFDKQDGQLWCHCILTHSSGHEIRASLPIVENLTNMQKLGAAITYARRYTTCMILGIEGEKDLDDPNLGKSETPPDNGQKTSGNSPTIDSSRKHPLTPRGGAKSKLEPGTHVVRIESIEEKTKTNGGTYDSVKFANDSGHIKINFFKDDQEYFKKQFSNYLSEEFLGTEVELSFDINSNGYPEVKSLKRTQPAEETKKLEKDTDFEEIPF